MAQEHADNDMSGTFNGPVAQIGQVHGTVNVAASQSGPLERLSATAINRRLTELSADDAAATLAVCKPEKAAAVLRLTPSPRRVEIIASMDPEDAEAILVLLDEDVAAILRGAHRAAQAIAADASEWHDVLGKPSGDIVHRGSSKRGATGYASHYERGTAYWSEDTGTGMVAGEIKKRYWKLGGHGGRLGYPIGRETKAGESPFGTSGSFQRFESTWDYGSEALEKIGKRCGATIYTSDKGTFATWGGIGEYYEASGGTWGDLGFPLSEEIDLQSPDNVVHGCYQEFEGGKLYWSESTGVACVQPAFEAVYDKGTWFLYGLPLGDQEPADASRYGGTGVYQRFQSNRGTAPIALIYSSKRRGTWAVVGTFRSLYEQSGASAGPFGFPTGMMRQHADPAGRVYRRQFFEGGAIMSGLGHEAIGVTGMVYEQWLEHSTELGGARSPERLIGDGPDVVQFFDGGIVTVASGVAEMWLKPQSPTAL